MFSVHEGAEACEAAPHTASHVKSMSGRISVNGSESTRPSSSGITFWMPEPMLMMRSPRLNTILKGNTSKKSSDGTGSSSLSSSWISRMNSLFSKCSLRTMRVQYTYEIQSCIQTRYHNSNTCKAVISTTWPAGQSWPFGNVLVGPLANLNFQLKLAQSPAILSLLF